MAINYRTLAFGAYPHRCVHCGFGIEEVLEVAHLDGNRQNCELRNLAILCPTCHRMHDLDLLPTDHITSLRDLPRAARWSRLMKDAGAKAAATRKRRNAGRKAARTRQERKKESAAE